MLAGWSRHRCDKPRGQNAARGVPYDLAMQAPPDPSRGPARVRREVELLAKLSRIVVITCLSAAAIAIVFAGLVVFEDPFGRVVALLSLGAAGLALLAMLPHAFVLRWARRSTRSAASPWFTLLAALCAAVAFPASVMFIFKMVPGLFVFLVAAHFVLLTVEVALVLIIWRGSHTR